MKSKLYIISFISIVSFFADRISKMLIMNSFSLHERKPLINGFLNITYTKNEGAAWSMFSGNRLMLIGTSIAVLIFMIYSIHTMKNLSKIEEILFGILIGGIIGNLFDRIVYSSVIDFIDVIIFGYDFPIFNIADSLIVISTLSLIIMSFRSDKNENKG